MYVYFTCPGCGHKFKTHDALAGRRVKCPQCKHRIAVPKVDVLPPRINLSGVPGARMEYAAWHVRSTSDPQWNADGKILLTVDETHSTAGYPVERVPPAAEHITQLRQQLTAEPPADLACHCEIKPPSPTAKLSQLFETHAAFSAEKQAILTDFLEGANSCWKLAPAESVIRFSFLDRKEIHAFPFQPLGLVAAPQDESLPALWQWAWNAADQDYPAASLRAAEQLRAVGQKEEIAELALAEFTLGTAGYQPWFNWHYLAMIASGICGADFYYKVPVREGVSAVLLVNASILPDRYPPNVHRMAFVLGDTLNKFAPAFSNHRQVALAYARQRGCHTISDTARQLVCADVNGHQLVVRFDDAGHVTMAEGQAAVVVPTPSRLVHLPRESAMIADVPAPLPQLGLPSPPPPSPMVAPQGTGPGFQPLELPVETARRKVNAEDEWVAAVSASPSAAPAANESIFELSEQIELVPEEIVGRPGPAAVRVARRALALAAVAHRALLEMSAKRAQAAKSLSVLLEFVKQAGLDDELEPAERTLIGKPLGKVPSQQATNSIWRAEGVAVLAWAIRRFDLPPYDREVPINVPLQSISFLQPDALSVVRNATLRSEAEVSFLASQYTIINWRLHKFINEPGRMELAGFLRRHPDFKKDWLRSIRVVKGDLALGKSSLADAKQEVVQNCTSIAIERQIAAYWLQGENELYSKVTPSTVLAAR